MDWKLIIAACLVVLVVVHSIFKYRCSKCKRFFALRKSWGMRGEAGHEEEEWKCRYCRHHREWKDVDRSAVGGDFEGDGGD